MHSGRVDEPPQGHVRFQISGVPVEVTPAFWIVTVVLAAARLNQPWMLLEWVAVVFVSVLVHELGHAVTAQGMGCTVRVQLHAMGGSAFHQGVELTPWQRALIALAGPLAGVALGAVVYVAAQLLGDGKDPVMERVLLDALWVNWGYGLLNLLPILPLDGGHVMQEVVNVFSRRKNETAAVFISLLVAVVLLLVALQLQMRSVLFLLGWIAISQYQRAAILYAERRDQALADDVAQLQKLHLAADAHALRGCAEKLLVRARSDRLKALAVQALAWSFAHQGQPVPAADVLRRMPANYRPDPALLAWLTAHAGAPEDALNVLRALWARSPDVETARLLVAAMLHLGHLDEAQTLVLTSPRKALDAGVLYTVEEALFRSGRFEDALKVSQDVVRGWKDPNGAYNAACSSVRLGDAPAALEWLGRAVELGYRDHAHLVADEDLAPLRSHPAFALLLQKLRR